MPSMDRDLIKNLASLARIELTSEEEKRFTSELGSVLKYVSQLSELKGGEDNLEIVPPNRFRADENPHASGVFSEDLLNSAPKRKGDHVLVKKILENGKS